MTEAPIRDENQLKKRKAREDANVFSRLPSVYAASRTQGQQLLQLGGLSIVEWRVLWDLSEVGPMTISELASTQRADHSLLSRALPAMRRKGYVDMQRGTKDGRQTIVVLTEAGKEAYEASAPVMARRRQALREAFSPEEITQIVDYLDRLEAFLRKPAEEILQEDAVK